MSDTISVLNSILNLLFLSFSQGGLIALLLLILLFTLVLYTRQRWCRRRRAPQKSASTEATHEIHYIPSVLLGPPQSRDGFRTPRTHQHGSVIGMAIRETPILDDCDCEDDEQPGQLLDGKVQMDEDFCSQGTRSMDSLGKGGCDVNHKHSLDNRGEMQQAGPGSRGLGLMVLLVLDLVLAITFWKEHLFKEVRRYAKVFLGVPQKHCSTKLIVKWLKKHHFASNTHFQLRRS